MTTDLEADLRHEFDAATPPSTLTFSPDSVVRQGSRTIRRRRIISAGSAAVAVGLIAVGSTLMTRPHNSATPQPATHLNTGIVKSSLGDNSGRNFQFELNRDARVTSNLKLFVATTPGAKRRELGTWAIAKPGQKPDAIWKSGMLGGHPFTVGLVPGIGADIEFAKGASHGISSDNTNFPGYTMFAVEYQNGNDKEATRPAEIARVAWAGPNGVLDGIEGDHRLTGRFFTIDRSVSVKVALRTEKGGRTTVFGAAQFTSPSGGGYATPLTVATTNASGAAVVTGLYATEHRVTRGKGQGLYVTSDGSPMAAGILPSGASDIGVDLASGKSMTGLAKTKPLPDGRVIFALNAKLGRANPNTDAIKAITWTNADGSQGHLTVNQKRPR